MRLMRILSAAWRRQRGVLRALLLGLGLIGLLSGALLAAERWLALAQDGIHDPSSPAIGLLQEPAEALAQLPPDTAGNLVRWVQALDQGHIKPRSRLVDDQGVELRITEVLLKNTGEMPMVRFPHRQHTAWLDCGNCHEELFERRAGATRINMFLILQGEKCGVCHGAVSFPLTECTRCHSVERGSAAQAEFGAALVRQP